MALLSQEAGFPPGLVNAPLLDSFTFDSLIAKLSDSFGFGSGLVNTPNFDFYNFVWGYES